MKSVKKLLVLIVVALVVIVGVNSIYIVKENEYAYVTRFAKIVAIQSEPGVSFKTPFVDNVSKLPKNYMLYDMNPSEVLTSDKKTLVVDNFTVWKIDDPYRFVQTVTYVGEMERRIESTVFSLVKNTLATLPQSEIISAGESSRDDINQSITEQVNAQLANYGVSIISTEIKRLDLPASNEQAVWARMISEREQMAESYRADGKYQANLIVNDTDKQVAILLAEAQAQAEQIQGDGEAQYMSILSAAYNTTERSNYYEFMRSLDALKASMQGEKTIILSKDSDIAKLLSGSN